MLSFDKYLGTHIKFGWFQIKMFLIVSFLDFIDAMETAFLGIFLSILAFEWDLTINQIIGLGTSFYLGVLTGNFFCAFFADKIGRKNSLIIGTLITFFTFVLNSQVQVYWEVVVMRLIYGAVFGAIMPLSSILLSEMVTKDLRGRTQTCLQITYTLGKIYLILTCLVFLNDLKSGNWRGLLLFNSAPALICFFLTFFSLRESGRFYLSKGRYSEAFKEISMMGKTNQGATFQITQEQKNQLIFWQINRFDDANEGISIKELFNKENRAMTLRLCGVYMTLQTSQATTYLLLPFWLQSQVSGGFISILYTYFAELAAGIILLFIIDKRELGGRLRIIIVSLVFMILSIILIYLNPERYLVLGVSSFKFFISLLFPSLIVFTNQSYSTLHRSMGMGLAQASGRFASSMTPLVAFSLYAIDPYFPLLVMICSLAISLIISCTFKLDQTQRSLDQSLISLLKK